MTPITLGWARYNSWARPRGAQLLAGYTVPTTRHPIPYILGACGKTRTDGQTRLASQLFFQYPAKSWEIIT